MTPVQIKIELLKVGITQREIARRANASEVEVSMCITGFRPYPHIREVVAQVINRPVAQVFNRHHPQPSNRQPRNRAA